MADQEHVGDSIRDSRADEYDDSLLMSVAVDSPDRATRAGKPGASTHLPGTVPVEGGGNRKIQRKPFILTQTIITFQTVHICLSLFSDTLCTY